MLQRPVGGDKQKIYLVSNKHVLCGVDSIALTFTKMKNGDLDLGNVTRVPINKIPGNIVSHPDPDIDIAIMECTGLFILLPDQLYFKAVTCDMLATFDEPELTVAQTVNFIGYPEDIYDVANNLPLVRTGIIASHPKYDYNKQAVFIIDTQVFPGSSGSLVFIDLTTENIKNGQIVLGKRDIKLLGMVSQTIIRNNQLKGLQTRTQLATEEILGLGIVYKSTVIKELVDSMPIDN